jgi:hypothetical protein
MKRALIIHLLILLFLPWPVWAEDKDFESFVEFLPKGRIDWDDGVFYGIGKGYPHLNKGSKARAIRVAQAGALSSILEIASGIRVDDRHTLSDLQKQNVIIQIKAIVQYEPFAREYITDKGEPYFKVTYRAPMKGVKGLTKLFLSQARTKPSLWKQIPLPGEPSVDLMPGPWLVLDARGLPKGTPVEPALFPRVVSQTGEVVYELGKVNETALEQRGMASYVVSDKTHEELLSWAGKLPFAWVMKLLSPPRVEAADKKRTRRREGYIISNATEAQGLMKTNLVISESDARKLKAEDKSNQILKQCRVVVIVSESLGGIEGGFPDLIASSL